MERKKGAERKVEVSSDSSSGIPGGVVDYECARAVEIPCARRLVNNAGEHGVSVPLCRRECLSGDRAPAWSPVHQGPSYPGPGPDEGGEANRSPPAHGSAKWSDPESMPDDSDNGRGDGEPADYATHIAPGMPDDDAPDDGSDDREPADRAGHAVPAESTPDDNDDGRSAPPSNLRVGALARMWMDARRLVGESPGGAASLLSGGRWLRQGGFLPRPLHPRHSPPTQPACLGRSVRSWWKGRWRDEGSNSPLQRPLSLPPPPDGHVWWASMRVSLPEVRWHTGVCPWKGLAL